MQLGDDLENEWIMFDHFKHLEGWPPWHVTYEFTSLCIIKS